jgi:predicted nuclease of predicted toxin-antitoxin system
MAGTPISIRFHLDENVHLVLAEALRRRGYDVTVPAEHGLIGASDEQHLAFARGQGRIVITHDADFLKIHARGDQHAGIAFCHVRQYSIRQLIRAALTLAMTTTVERMANRVEYL